MFGDTSKKKVKNVLYNGDLFRLVGNGSTLNIRVFEHGLNKGYELDRSEVPKEIEEIIREEFG